jgi:hypothetical protein
MHTTDSKLKVTEGPSEGGRDIEMCSLEGAANQELQGTGAPQEAPWQDPSSASVESLAEKVSTLGFQKA